MKPEVFVRSMVHRLGYRFRLHRRDLPGTPDLVLSRHRTVIFVNGCFWHWHSDPQCPISGLPKSNLSYWQPKLARTRIRDQENARSLEAQGWRALTVWECQLGSPVDVFHKIRVFLGPGKDGTRTAPRPHTYKIGAPVGKVRSPEKRAPYPPTIDNAVLRALFDNLGGMLLVAEPQASYGGQVVASKRETTALVLDRAIREVTRLNWRGNRRAENRVRNAIKRVLKEDALADSIFQIVKAQDGY